MRSEGVKKVSAGYFAAVVFLPIALILLGGVIGYRFFREGGTGAVICFMAPTMLAVLWWFIGPSAIWKTRKKAMEKTLDAHGFTRNQTFLGRGQTVVVDQRQGMVALLFFWNPFTLYCFPASRITDVWAEDGAGGAGFLRGTSQVGFLFRVDGVKVRVNTFISNQRWKMEDPRVLEGISKADMWVQVLERARQGNTGA